MRRGRSLFGRVGQTSRGSQQKRRVTKDCGDGGQMWIGSWESIQSPRLWICSLVLLSPSGNCASCVPGSVTKFVVSREWIVGSRWRPDRENRYSSQLRVCYASRTEFPLENACYGFHQKRQVGLVKGQMEYKRGGQMVQLILVFWTPRLPRHLGPDTKGARIGDNSPS